MRIILIISIATVFAGDIFSQGKLDSLQYKLKNGSGRDSLYVYAQPSNKYTDNLNALSSARKAYIIAGRLSDSLRLVQSASAMGSSYRELDFLDSAITIDKKVLAIAKRNGFMAEYGNLLNELGLTYTLSAKYDEALKCHFEALAISKTNDYKHELVVTLIHIGFVYYKIEDTKKAIDYYLQALELSKGVIDQDEIDMLFINLGLCYASIVDYARSLHYIKNVSNHCNNGCPRETIMNVEFALGTVSFGMKKLDVAEEHFVKSYTVAEELKDERFQFDNITYLSKVYLLLNKPAKAEEYLDAAEGLVSGTPYNLELIKLYEQFFSLYSKTGDIKKMTVYQEKYIQLKDSIYSDALTNNLMKVQAEFLEKENKARIESQEQTLKLKDEVITRQIWLNVLAGVAAILLIIIVYMLYKSNIQRKAANELLDQRVVERTKELEISYEHLRKTLEEGDLTLEKTAADIRSSIATMRGLTTLALREAKNPETVTRIQKIEEAINTLSETLKVMQEQAINEYTS